MKLSEIKYTDSYGTNRISVEHQEVLIELALETCIENESILRLGSLTVKEMRQVYNKIRWKKYLEILGKDFNDLTEEDIEEICLMEARDKGYEV